MANSVFYLRSNHLIAATSRNVITFVEASEASAPAITHETNGVADWSALLQTLSSPTDASTVELRLQSMSERDASVFEDLISTGLIRKSNDQDLLIRERDRVFTGNIGFHMRPREPIFEHVVFACTGSIVSGLMAPTILSLCYSRFQRQIDVILTEAAQKFMTRDLLEHYGIRTWSDAFERRDDIYVPHVQLGRSADLVVVLPATASSLHRLAETSCTDLLSMLVAATQAPVVLSPVMNAAMLNNSGVQRNIERLRNDGMHIIEPTIIFGAADVANQGHPMYGGHGSLWQGPAALMAILSAVGKARPQ